MSVMEHEARLQQLQQAELAKRASMHEDIEAKLRERRKKKETWHKSTLKTTSRVAPEAGTFTVAQNALSDSSPAPAPLMMDDAAGDVRPEQDLESDDSPDDDTNHSSSDSLLLVDPLQVASEGELHTGPADCEKVCTFQEFSPASRQQETDIDSPIGVPSPLSVTLSNCGSLDACRGTALLDRSTPRTAARELLNIDLETWLVRGTSQDIIDCIRSRSPLNSPLCTQVLPESTSSSRTNPCPSSAGSLSQAATLSFSSNTNKKIQVQPNGFSMQTEAARPKSATVKRHMIRPLHRPLASWGATWDATVKGHGGQIKMWDDWACPVDPLRSTDLPRSQGYSPVVNRMMARGAELERLNAEMSKMKIQNQALLTENRKLASYLQQCQNDQSNTLMHLEESVQVSCALRAQLTAAQAKAVELHQSASQLAAPQLQDGTKHASIVDTSEAHTRLTQEQDELVRQVELFN